MTKSTRHGMFLALGAYTFFAVLDALLKLASAGGYPPAQLIFTMTITAAFTLVVLSYFRGGVQRLKTKRLPFHIGRALFNVSSMFANLYALTRIPLPDFYSIVFLGPLLHVLLGMILLHEDVSWKRGGAILIGFSGAILMLPFAAMQPLSGPSEAYYICLLQPIFTATGNLLVRKYGQNESNYSFPFYTALTLATASGICLFIGGGKMFELNDLVKVLVAGVLSGIGTLCLMTALQRIPPAFVSPFQYTQMVWGIVFGLLFWHYIPSLQTGVGALIIIASGYYLLRFKEIEK